MFLKARRRLLLTPAATPMRRSRIGTMHDTSNVDGIPGTSTSEVLGFDLSMRSARSLCCVQAFRRHWLYDPNHRMRMALFTTSQHGFLTCFPWFEAFSRPTSTSSAFLILFCVSFIVSFCDPAMKRSERIEAKRCIPFHPLLPDDERDPRRIHSTNHESCKIDNFSFYTPHLAGSSGSPNQSDKLAQVDHELQCYQKRRVLYITSLSRL